MSASGEQASQDSSQPAEDWRAEVRRLAEARDWAGALRVVDGEIARSPQDLDVKAWRARVLTWAGRLEEAEHTYREILHAEEPAQYDPDHWAGLATVCWREGKLEEALHAGETAVQVDPKRADLHETYGRILLSAGRRAEAEDEFKKAGSPDLAKVRAHQAIKTGKSVYGLEVRAGSETDLLNYAAPNQAQSASLSNYWTPNISTNLGFGTYQRGGIFGGKFVGSVTAHGNSAGVVTIGGAVAADNGVIPRSEGFFDLDQGHKFPSNNLIRGIEVEYGQHWYWYATARILALNGGGTVYFPRDWSFTLNAIGARSAFSGIGAEWRPSGLVRLAFPLRTWSTAHINGNVFFAAGTENFGRVDQIGRFASQTYGGGLRWHWTERQFVSYTGSYQRRTQGRTDFYIGLSYGIGF